MRDIELSLLDCGIKLGRVRRDDHVGGHCSAASGPSATTTADATATPPQQPINVTPGADLWHASSTSSMAA